jgi:SAM-dependent methyltransferase
LSIKNAKTTGYNQHYHDRQFVSPYESTKAFCNWLCELGVIREDQISNIGDLGCGKGANLYYMAKRFPNSRFTGVDIDEKLIRNGKLFLSSVPVDNCELFVGDIHTVDSQFCKHQFDGIVSLQTLSWLPGYKKALDAITKLSPKWIALTSLFYDGPVEAKTVITQFGGVGNDDVVLNYNTYSIPEVKSYLCGLGFTEFKYLCFDIPIDLPRNSDGKMQTFTEKTDIGRRLQVSGPLLLNWYFIYAARI